MPDLRKLLKPLRTQINRRLKLDIVRTDGHHHCDSHIRKMIRDYRIDAVIDVGANVGAFGALVRSIGFDGDIFSIEPVAKAFDELLKATARDERWRAYPIGLGSEAGKSLINVTEISDLSSILPPNDLGREIWKGMNITHREEIELSTLDQFIDRHLAPDIKRIFLKMDTQGYDLQVFAGARGSLGRIACVLSELSLAPIYHGMPDYLEALATYKRGGFSVSGIYPILRSANLSLIEVDCVLVNTSMF
jgi:FkbM family methyltransferase